MSEKGHKLKEYDGVPIYINEFGTFSAELHDKVLKDSTLMGLENTISELMKIEGDREDCYIYNYLYKLLPGKVVRYTYDHIHVVTQRGARDVEQVGHDSVFPKCEKNDAIYKKIDELADQKREVEREWDARISAELKGIQHYPKDYFLKKLHAKLKEKVKALE